MPEFKDMLKFFRMREHLSQSELAEKLGISASTVSMYEVGRRQPDFETEEKIADFFNTDLNTLRGRDNESEQPTYYLDKNLLTLHNFYSTTQNIKYYLTRPEKSNRRTSSMSQISSTEFLAIMMTQGVDVQIIVHVLCHNIVHR